jgi:Uma2 family endonuclease
MTAHEVIDYPGAYRLRVADFRVLGESGAFDAFAKVELIEGVIVAGQSQYSPHSRAQTLLLKTLSIACDRIDNRVQPWVELSIAIAADSEPQPDIVVAHGLPDTGAIAPAEVALVVEIADTSAKFDLGAKADLYASAGIAEYWVADVNAKIIHQMWAPEGEAYAERREVAFGALIEAVTIAGLTVKTAGI